MLAKNNLRNTISTRLRIFPGLFLFIICYHYYVLLCIIIIMYYCYVYVLLSGSKHLHEDRLPASTKSILED